MPKKGATPARTASFIETMDCLPVAKVPEGAEWTYEIKLDGYRLEAVKSGKEVALYSRRRNLLNKKFPYIAAALKDLPEGTVIDGELVALGPDGRPDFNLLQNFRSAEARIIYYAFDILVHKGRDLTRLKLSERREILAKVIKASAHVALSQVSDRSAAEMLKFVKEAGSKASSRSVPTASISLALERDYGASTGSILGRSSSLAAILPATWASMRLWWASIAVKT
jgi:ATP-dependent DNA ligase